MKFNENKKKKEKAMHRKMLKKVGQFCLAAEWGERGKKRMENEQSVWHLV